MSPFNLLCLRIDCRARRVLKQLRLPPTHNVDFKEFYELNDRFPAAYAPIFNLQNSMRKKVCAVITMQLLVLMCLMWCTIINNGADHGR
jgi:hypothetical protein